MADSDVITPTRNAPTRKSRSHSRSRGHNSTIRGDVSSGYRSRSQSRERSGKAHSQHQSHCDQGMYQ